MPKMRNFPDMRDMRDIPDSETRIESCPKKIKRRP